MTNGRSLFGTDGMRGVANVIIPTFTQDLRGLNERAIRHDVRKEIEYGFWGALLVAETATTLPEYSQFATWAADEAKGKLHFIHHASQPVNSPILIFRPEGRKNQLREQIKAANVIITERVRNIRERLENSNARSRSTQRDDNGRTSANLT